MRLLEIPGIEEGENSWGDDRALWVNAKQMANFRGPRALEIRLGRALIRELKARLKDESRVTRRGSSDWVGFEFETADDFAFVEEMAALATLVYLPADGLAPKPPPTGAAMERRKRFH
jgi:hypothetical protein